MPHVGRMTYTLMIDSRHPVKFVDYSSRGHSQFTRALDGLTTILPAHAIYVFLIKNFGNFLAGLVEPL